MKLLPLALCLLFAVVTATPAARAQQQEQGLIDRIDAKGKLAMQAMDSNSRRNPALDSPLSSRSFNGASSMTTKSFATSEFGTKTAATKTYETRSFFGVKNPWFGKKVFATKSAETRTASEASKQYNTESYAVREYDKARQKDLLDSGTAMASGNQPRPYLVQPKAEGGVSRFTENLQKDLTIDDVRDLLNKGTGSR